MQGKVDPDEFYVHKPTFRQGYRAVLRRSLGGKAVKRSSTRAGMATPARAICRRTAPNASASASPMPRSLELADCAIRIEDHYSQLAGHPTPMDIEWAKDGEDGRLYIVQARPETVASQRRAEASKPMR